jgi:hypothetical protein
VDKLHLQLLVNDSRELREVEPRLLLCRAFLRHRRQIESHTRLAQEFDLIVRSGTIGLVRLYIVSLLWMRISVEPNREFDA